MDTLLPDVCQPPRRFTVTVTMPRPDGDDALVPPHAHAMLELAAAAVAADGLVTAWTCAQSAVSMIVDAASGCDALAAGLAVARALPGGDGVTSVTAEPVTAALR